MQSNRLALAGAGYVIVACAATISLTTHAASPTSADSSGAVAHPMHSKPKAGREGADEGKAQRRGLASYYSKHLAGNKTSSGERYDPDAMTAAHRSLPMGTKVKVVNPRNDKSVVVTVNDRGPVPKNRMIDLSNAAASKLGMTKAGVVKVETEVVGKTSLQAPGDAKP